MAKKLTEIDVLEGALAFFDSPKKWLRGAFVERRADGTVCACVDGALRLSAGARMERKIDTFDQRSMDRIYRSKAYIGACERLERLVPDGSIWGFNDEAKSVTEIRAVLRKAIKAAKKAAA